MENRLKGVAVYAILTVIILVAAGQLSQFQYSRKRFNILKDRHNIGCLLREKRQVKLAVSTSKILFYYQLPPRRLDLSDIQVNCTTVEALEEFNLPRSNVTEALWRRICPDLNNLLSAFHILKLDTLNYYQLTMDKIYSMIADTGLRRRNTRGVWTDGWGYRRGMGSPKGVPNRRQWARKGPEARKIFRIAQGRRLKALVSNEG